MFTWMEGWLDVALGPCKAEGRAPFRASLLMSEKKESGGIKVLPGSITSHCTHTYYCPKQVI